MSNVQLYSVSGLTRLTTDYWASPMGWFRAAHLGPQQKPSKIKEIFYIFLYQN